MQKTKDDDFQTIVNIQKGDISQFRVLVEKYKDVSFSFAYSLLRNEAEAEDATQEAFIKAYRALPAFRFQSKFSTWLYKIVVNICRTQYKRQQNIAQHQQNYQSQNNIIVSSDNTFDKLEANERKHIINQILDKLKPEESLLLRLFYLSELSITEIKQITTFKESKIKVSLHRARKSFREQYQKVFPHQKEFKL